MPDKRHAANGWKEYKMSDLATFDSKSLSNDTPEDYTFKYISLADVNQGMMNENLTQHIFSTAPLRARRCVKKNDVLMSTVRPNLKGFARIKEEVTDVIASTGFAVISPRIESDSEYIHQYLYSFKIDRQIYALVVGSNYPAINSTDVKKLRVLAPVLPQERERIGNILALWDTAIEKMDKLIEAKRSRHVALANKLLSRKSSAVPLKKFLKLTLRDAAKPGKPYWALGIRSHGKGTFRRFVENPKTVAMDTLYRVRHDDLIVNITFAWEGAIAFVDKADEDCFVSHRFPSFEVDSNKALPAYLRHVIVQKRFVRNLVLISPGGAGRNRVLNKTDFLNLKISLPEIEEQEKIGDVLNASLREISLLEAKLELLEKQKRGLMQKLLTGEWRVKVG